MSKYPFVVFLDLDTLVKRKTGEPAKVQPGAERLLALSHTNRVGVIAYGHAGLSAEDVARLLASVGLGEGIEPGLIVADAGAEGGPPAPTVFVRAAEQAGLELGQCVFVGTGPLRVIVAEGVGMRGVLLPSSELPVTPTTVQVEASPEPVALDAGFVLRGRIVTMDDQDWVIDDGQIWIHEGRIQTISVFGEPLPEGARTAPVIETKGTIYPGLIDLHNHFVYNVLPLWRVPKQYSNRTQWPRHADYRPQISRPVKALAGYSRTAKALVRYVEAKAVIGGTTTGQGMRTRVAGGSNQFEGAMRNVEIPEHDHLPAAGTRVPDLNARSDEAIESFRRSLETRRAYFYHLSEGKDDAARARVLDLIEHNLLGASLVGIHALGLEAQDYDELASVGAKIVWSPFSNLLLYGETLDLGVVLASGVQFSLGCDWSPTGSKNLLQELKVARHEARRQGVSLEARRLVRAVTADAARVAVWHEELGSLRPGALADLLVVYGADGDPYEHLIDAREGNVDLVVIDGVARYGEPRLMKPLHAADDLIEPWTAGGRVKLLALQDEGSPLEELGMVEAKEILEEAMGDMRQFVQDQARDRRAGLLADGSEPEPEFVVEVDNELDESDEHFEAMLRGNLGLLGDADVGIADRIPLDGAEVGLGDYWERVVAQYNLTDELKQQLQEAYPNGG